MAIEYSLRRLLRSSSRLGQACRLALVGFRAQLQAALAEGDGDPAGEAASEVLAALGEVMEVDGEAPPVLELADVIPPPPVGNAIRGVPEPTDPPAALPVTPGANATGLAARPATSLLAQSVREARLEEHPQIVRHCGPVKLRGGQDDELWPEIGRLLLRLPSSAAKAVNNVLSDVLQRLKARTEEDRGQATMVPLHRDEWLFPALTGAVQAPGLFASNASPHPSLGAWPDDSELRVLAGATSFLLAVIDIDTELHLALKDLYRFGIIRLNADYRNQLRSELLHRYQRVLSETANAADALRARLDLDEALHSVIHSPPADRESWWGQLQWSVRQRLEPAVRRAAQACGDAYVQVLWGPYANVRKYTRADANLEVDQGGVPGEVVACLRVYARIQGEVFPGRVIHRSLK